MTIKSAIPVDKMPESAICDIEIACTWCELPFPVSACKTARITRSLQDPPPPESVETWHLCPTCWQIFERL